MNGLDLSALVDAAVPQPPESMLRPPLRAIRRRAHRRRTRLLTAAAAVLVVLIGVPVAVLTQGLGRATVKPGPAAQDPHPSATAAAADRLNARFVSVALDRDDRTVHLQIPLSVPRADLGHDPHGCQEIAETVVTQDADRVVITIRTRRFGTVDGCSGGAGQTSAVQLDAPLGTRPVIDGSVAQERPVLRIAQLPWPKPGSGYQVHQPTVLDASYWAWAYELPDGLSLFLDALPYPAGTGGRLVDAVHLGGRAVEIYQSDVSNPCGTTPSGSSCGAVWSSDGWYFRLWTSGRTPGVSPAEFRQLLDGLSWS